MRAWAAGIGREGCDNESSTQKLVAGDTVPAWSHFHVFRIFTVPHLQTWCVQDGEANWVPDLFTSLVKEGEAASCLVSSSSSVSPESNCSLLPEIVASGLAPGQRTPERQESTEAVLAMHRAVCLCCSRAAPFCPVLVPVVDS